MLGVGDSAPSFSLVGTDGTAVSTYAFEDFLADGPALLAFFPFAFSPACTEEICSLRDVEWFSIVDGFSVVGVSTDGPFALRAFASEHDVDFPLLSDGDGAVADALGVRAEEIEGVGNRVNRSTFLVDESGTIRHVIRLEDPYETPDLTAIRDAAADLDAV